MRMLDPDKLLYVLKYMEVHGKSLNLLHATEIPGCSKRTEKTSFLFRRLSDAAVYREITTRRSEGHSTH